ncbi:MAG: alkaline phosphatase family protein [Deltaproteobacteria bacterium]|nr:alkaline phosphatase family protein [Deltaproteobacteria bacterium]
MRAVAPELPQVAPWTARGVAALRYLTGRGLCSGHAHANGRRFVILHLDGVSKKRLERGMADGTLPRLRDFLARGDHRMSPLYAGSPSSTPSFQAGLLWGVRADAPGFLWYDKRLGRPVSMNLKADASRVEDDVSAGRRGLLEDGTTYFSLFTGGSRVNAFTLTGWSRDEVRLHPGANGWDVASLFAIHALTATNVIGGAIVESANAVADVLDWAAHTARFDHERAFLTNRVLLSAGARNYATYATVLDIARGVPSIYACFADYDEIAHRRGPDSRQALRALEATDRAAGVILDAALASGNDYDIYLLADHGQVSTRPFEAVTGATLHEVVGGANEPGPMEKPDPRHRLANVGRAFWRAAQRRLGGVGQVEAALVGALRGAARSLQRDVQRETVVIDAGDIAHVYFTADPEPMTLEQIQARLPGVIEAVVGSRAAGVVAVRGGRGGYAFRNGRRIDLSEPAADLALGLGYGGRRVRAALQAMLGMRSSGDLVVYGNGLRESDVAFAWEFGSHGGIAADEVDAFMIHPARTPFDFSRVEHASELYGFFTRHYGIETEPGQRAAGPRHA